MYQQTRLQTQQTQMDCYDVYVHELLMNTNAKIPSIFKEKKNIVNKICCLIKRKDSFRRRYSGE